MGNTASAVSAGELDTRDHRQVVTKLGLKSLPAELRIQIYRLVLITPATLRSKLEFLQKGEKSWDSADSIGLSAFTQNALLWTCRMAYLEAAPMFYSENRFHFPVLSEGPFRSLSNHAGLSIMREISIGFGIDWVKHLRRRNNIHAMAKVMAAAVTGYIQSILDNCHSLKSLTINFISNMGIYPVMDCLVDQEQVTEAFCALKARLDHINIVAESSLYDFSYYETMLGSPVEWEILHLPHWPDISLTPKELPNIKMEIDQYTWSKFRRY
ncbi:hypothetical protein MMC28_004336 [Mycoblastus sanguinarius]|nr:hypothetical protein [Mycoblastus sanguinarius]